MLLHGLYWQATPSLPHTCNEHAEVPAQLHAFRPKLPAGTPKVPTNNCLLKPYAPSLHVWNFSCWHLPPPTETAVWSLRSVKAALPSVTQYGCAVQCNAQQACPPRGWSVSFQCRRGCALSGLSSPSQCVLRCQCCGHLPAHPSHQLRVVEEQQSSLPAIAVVATMPRQQGKQSSAMLLGPPGGSCGRWKAAPIEPLSAGPSISL